MTPTHPHMVALPSHKHTYTHGPTDSHTTLTLTHALSLTNTTWVHLTVVVCTRRCWWRSVTALPRETIRKIAATPRCDAIAQAPRTQTPTLTLSLTRNRTRVLSLGAHLQPQPQLQSQPEPPRRDTIAQATRAL